MASKNIDKWFVNKINSVNKIRDIIINFNHKNSNEVLNILKNSNKIAGLKNIYVGYDDNTIFSSIKWNKPKDYNTKSRPWYKNTLKEKRTVITKPYIDVGLKEIVISICTALKEKVTNQEGVICGILPLNKIKNEILDIYLPFDGITFVTDKNGKIILHPNPEKLLRKSNFTINKNSHSIINEELEESIFSHNYIKSINLYIVSKLKKSSVYEKLNLQLLINFIIYFISLIVFLLLNYFYYKYQKNSDNKLKKIENILKRSIEQTITGKLIIDNEDKIIFYNKKLIELLNIKPNDIIEKKLDRNSYIFNNINELNKNNIVDKIKLVKSEYEEKEFFFKDKRLDNRTCFFHLIISPVLNKNNIYQGIIFIFKDITLNEQKKIKQKQHDDIMFQQSKMADLGEMLGAVSHQWKQPLNSLSLMLSNLIQFKKMDVLTDKIFEENITSGISTVKYLSDTLNTFKNFYLPQKTKEEFDVKSSIDEVLTILSPYFKNSGIIFEIKTNTDKSLICNNYKNEFQQIIINLLHNSKDAIFEDKNNEKRIVIYIEKINEKRFDIKVSDYGNGIPDDVKEHLFESFYTSKKEGKGTGKGLYISKLIAKEKLEGNLKLISYKKPTTFLLELYCHGEKRID